MGNGLRQPNEALSGTPLYPGGTITPACNGVWHIPAYVSNTAGVTLTVTTPTSTIAAALAVPGTNAATTVASVIVPYAIPVINGYTYALSGTGLTFPEGGGVILAA